MFLSSTMKRSTVELQLYIINYYFVIVLVERHRETILMVESISHDSEHICHDHNCEKTIYT